MLIIIVFGIGCGFPLGTSIWAFFINIPFLRDLKGLPTIPVPVVLLIKFRSFTNFYLITSFTWYIGVALFGILFFRDLDAFSGFVILSLSALGLSVFIYPQFVCHGFLVDAYNQVADGVVSTYRKSFGFRTLRDVASDPEASDEFDRFNDLIELSEPGQLWVYDLNDVFVLILGQAIALSVVAFQGILK